MTAVSPGRDHPVTSLRRARRGPYDGGPFPTRKTLRACTYPDGGPHRGRFHRSVAAPAAALASPDLTHGQRFGDKPNGIVDVSSDGTFMVATQGKGVVRYDLDDLGAPKPGGLYPDLDAAPGDGSGEELELERTDAAGNGVVFANTEPGPTSVALVRDRWIIAPYNASNDNVDPDDDEQVDPGDLTVDPVDGLVILDARTMTPVRTVLFDDANATTSIAGAPTGTPGQDALLEVPDSVAVSPDGTRAMIAVENDREFGQPVTATNPSPGGVPGFIRADTSNDDPANWRFDLVRLPAAYLTSEGEKAQPEFVDINAKNEVVASIQEANDIAVFDAGDVGTGTELTESDIHDVGSSTFLADASSTNPVSLTFGTTIARERQPDSVGWAAGGTHVVLANEGEETGGTRDFSIHRPDGTLVSKIGSAFDQAAADDGFLGDDRNTLEDKGSEPEGLEVATIDGREYAFVLGERSESLSTWDISAPGAPRLISHAPTGEAPEGVKANPRRGFVIVANADTANAQGDAAFLTLHRIIDTSLLPEDRLIPRGSGTPYFDVRGLGGGVDAEAFATVDGTVPTRLLETKVGGRGYAPLRATAAVGGAGAGKVLQDVAPAPGGGAWVVSTADDFELARVDASGAVVGTPIDVPGPGNALSGVVVSPDGGTVWVSSAKSGATPNPIRRVDVATRTVTNVSLGGLAANDQILDLALAGDGDLLAVEANPNANVSTARVSRLDDPAGADGAIAAADRSVLRTIPVPESRSSTDMTGLALRPGGELWGVSGSRDGGAHVGHADLRRLVTLKGRRARPARSGRRGPRAPAARRAGQGRPRGSRSAAAPCAVGSAAPCATRSRGRRSSPGAAAASSARRSPRARARGRSTSPRAAAR